jgi:ParB family protein of integrating conjugative element (PFGI_1 class)
MSKQRPTLEERLQNLQQGFFGRNGELKEADPIEPTPLLVPLERIRPYDRNPRHERNEAYDRIKQLISSRGFTGSLPITRRPGDRDYMVAEGGNTVLQILKELYAERGDPRFHTVQCLFEPWVSESTTLIAHLVENEARGELLFIDRARAVRELRALLEEESGQKFSARQLASVLRERGYPIDHSLIVKMDYTVESLFPVIPMALRAGMGRPQVERIRKLETVLVEFLKYRSQEAAFIEEARAFFLDCLARHDSEEWLLEPIEEALIDYVARVSGEDRNKVLADFDAIATFGQPGSDALSPAPSAAHPARPLPKTADAPSQAAPDDQDEDPGAEGIENEPTVIDVAWPGVDRDLTSHVLDSAEAPEARVSTFGLKPLDRHELPQDVKSLRVRMWTLATQLAQPNGLGVRSHRESHQDPPGASDPMPLALLRPEAIDRDLFRRLINYVSQLRALKGIRDELLTHDAPLTLMHHFFGMDSTEYAERGRALGLVCTVGRPSEPTEAEEATLWKAYEALNLPNGADLTPGDYLRLYKATEIPLRTLWMVIQRWLAQGQPDVLPPPETKHTT